MNLFHEALVAFFLTICIAAVIIGFITDKHIASHKNDDESSDNE